MESFLDFVARAEGTDRGDGYNETLGYGKFTGGDVDLTGMTINEVLDLQARMLAHPENTFNSSAVGRYQIVARTLRDLMARKGLTGNELFDEAMQDRLAMTLAERRGADPEGLMNEWEGLRNYDPQTILDVYGGGQYVPRPQPRPESVSGLASLSKGIFPQAAPEVRPMKRPRGVFLPHENQVLADRNAAQAYAQQGLRQLSGGLY